jgi:hypothetical protein
MAATAMARRNERSPTWLLACLSLFILLFVRLHSVCHGFQASLTTRVRRPTRSSSSSRRSDARRTVDWYSRVRQMSSEVREDEPPENTASLPKLKSLPSKNDSSKKDSAPTSIWSLWDTLRKETARRRPPADVEDFNVLFYDVVLLLNLSLSISLWVVHRLDVYYIGAAFGEGCLMCILWIGAGLYTGAFLNSAVDGHFGSSDERSGPKAAGLLGFQTYLNAINLRLVFALIVAVLEHRPVGAALGEQLLPLEISFGLILMGCWRALHSSFTPRM